MQIAMSIPTQPVPDYARPLPILRTRQTRWGTAGCVVAALTLLYTVGCSIGLAHSKGWEALGWLFYGFYGNWLGASAGFLLGLIGCFRRRHFRASALRAMGYSAVVAVIPIAVFFTAYFINVYAIKS